MTIFDKKTSTVNQADNPFDEIFADKTVNKNITVTGIKENPKGGNLQAFCSVELSNGVQINSLRIIEQEGQAPWVSLPQSEWTSMDGKRRFTPIIQVPAPLKDEISRAVLSAWAAYLQGGGK